jgi:hypothetical protein
MPRITEKPLTVPALNKFFEVMENGIDESSLQEDTKFVIKRELLWKIIPAPLSECGIIYPVLSIREGRRLPHTMERLREITSTLHGPVFNLEPDTAGKEIYGKILEKALRAASREMQKDTYQSRG